MRVAVIGSGLSAVSAIKTLIARGIKPVVLDIGDKLDNKTAATVAKLSQLEPQAWSKTNKRIIKANSTLSGNNSIPKKLAFGSDYFYGNSTHTSPIAGTGTMPPFSTAKGGFSVGWGATVLPADDNDLIDWPIKTKDLKKYYQQVLCDIPLSAQQDGLAQYFPIYADHQVPLALTRGNDAILKDMADADIARFDHIAFGQSRIMVNAVDQSASVGCKSCGQCMSGCVYGCIYKSNQDLDRMIGDGNIEYISGVTVKSLNEKGKTVEVSLQSKNKLEKLITFDRVILAAGAVNSTRIVLESKQLYQQEVTLKSTVGFIVPMFRFKRHPLDWPEANTQPGIFLEYKARSLSERWIHTQISTPNELVISKIGYDMKSKGVVSAAKKYLLEHMVIAHANMHSEHANGYIMQLEKASAGQNNTLKFKRQNNNGVKRAVRKAETTLFTLGSKFGCYPILPFSQNYIVSGGYHLGGSLPMTLNPTKETDTNLLGTPKGWHRVHVVDSSVFPSIPGTTIGLLAMANAARIAANIPLD